MMEPLRLVGDAARDLLDIAGDISEFDAEAADAAEDLRARTVQLGPPRADLMFDHVYSEPHPLIAEQRAWREQYEASFEGGQA